MLHFKTEKLVFNRICAGKVKILAFPFYNLDINAQVVFMYSGLLWQERYLPLHRFGNQERI